MQVSTFQTILSIFSSSIVTVYKTEVSRQKSSAKQKDMKNHLSSVKLPLKCFLHEATLV